MILKKLVYGPIVASLYKKALNSSSKEYVLEDLRLWSEKMYGRQLPDKEMFFKRMSFDPKFRTLFYHRVNCSGIIKRILPPAELLFIRKTTEIAPGGVFFVHPWCTRIGARKIGKNCTIRHLTTIGSNGDPKKMDATPIIGDNVDIGCLCGIFGDIVIGNNVKIGAGSIIVKSVPDNCVVVGNPAKIIKQNGVRVNIPL